MGRVVLHGCINEQFLVLERICVRGKNYFYAKKDSRGIDLFEHMQQEVAALKTYMEDYGSTMVSRPQRIRGP